MLMLLPVSVSMMKMIMIMSEFVRRVACVAASTVKEEELPCSKTEERLKTLVEDNTCKVKHLSTARLASTHSDNISLL